LNLLFGTIFPVMVQNRGRSQTTQGVWMAMSQSQQGNKDNVVVFDVEGVDSRERGEHHLVKISFFFNRKGERKKERKREREKEREKERDKEREREREKERKRKRDKIRKNNFNENAK